MKQYFKYICKPIDILLNIAISKVTTKKELGKIIQKSGKIKYPKRIKEWENKWKVLGKPNKDYYRVFSKFIGENIDIVPDNINHNVVIPILNPKRYISTYEDKNLFDKFLSSCETKRLTPPTLLRCINATLYDESYNLLSNKIELNSILQNENFVIAKPSIDGASGFGVMFFKKNSNAWEEVNSGEKLTLKLLAGKIGDNYILQRVMEQSPFMSSLCKTSVNTIRIAIYRSIKDNSCNVLRTIVRIGKDGSLVDNAHAGGMFVGVDENGKLSNYFCDQYGNTINTFNGIDLTNCNLVIPNYDKVIELAKKISSRIEHLRLLALDIMLDKDNNPVLIEYNVKAFAPWLFQFSIGTAYANFTDEIIDYCQQHKSEASRVFVTF